MPRGARHVLAGVPLHVIQRGNNRQACFRSDADRERYLGWLKDYAEDCGCAVHAYVLMGNHVHLLLTPREAAGAARLMKSLGQRYVQDFNRRHGRSGTLWEGRFRSCIVQSERYLLTCARYIELNPVRAAMVARPADYRWSSHRANARGVPDGLIRPHALYLALGTTPQARCAAYRGLFRQAFEPAQLEDIRRATNANAVLGAEPFRARVARQLGRRIGSGRRGRPPGKGDRPL